MLFFAFAQREKIFKSFFIIWLVGLVFLPCCPIPSASIKLTLVPALSYFPGIRIVPMLFLPIGTLIQFLFFLVNSVAVQISDQYPFLNK